MLWTAALGAQSLVVTPLELEFEAEVGQPSPPSQTFQIQSTPAGQSFSARVNRSTLVNPSWLFDPLPTNGQTPATLTVAVDTTGFTGPGVLVGEIIVNAGGQQAIVKVTMTVTGATQGPRIEAAPNRLTFNIQSAGGSAEPQNLIVSNAGGGFLNYQLGISYTAGGAQGWLSLTPPTSGRVGAGSNQHQVNLVNTGALQQGTHTAQIRITGSASNSPLSIPVTLTVGAAPALSATPSSLSFFTSEGVPVDAQNLTIRNTSTTHVAYTIADDQPWLAVQPSAGNTASGAVTHQVTVDVTGLAQGIYLGNLQLTGAGLGAPFVIPVQLTVGAPSTLFVLPSRIDFVGNSGIPIRERRSISVVNTPLGPGRWNARVVPATATWLKLSPAEGSVPGRIQVEVDATAIGAATVNAEIEIRPGGGSAPLSGEDAGPQQTGAAVCVPVSATILSSQPALDAAPKMLLFRATAGQDAVLQQALLVENTGGPQLLWQSETTVESGDWLSISPSSGEAPARARVAADTSGLSAGVYHGKVRLEAGQQSATVAVALVVEAAGASLDTDVSSLYWEMTEDGTPPASRDVEVLNRGAGTMNWTAAAVDFSGSQQWFGIGPASGASRADGQAGPAEFTVTPIGTGLSAGVYGGLIEVRAEGQNPRLVTATLRVVPAAETVQRRVNPGGIAFVAGASLEPQTATVARNRSGAAPFVAGASTANGEEWLSVTPINGTATEAGVVTLEITADPTGLAAGIYDGQVGVTFGDGLVESVAATLIVPPSGGGACTPSSFAIVPTSPPQGFRALTGRAEQLEVELWDNCGQLLEQASVLASFSVGDAALPLRRIAEGKYAATWGPANAGSQANVVFTALAGTLTAQRFVVGAVEGSSHPAISRGGVVNAGSFVGGEAISPGAIISVFGRNFELEELSAAAVPLPLDLGGLRMRLGGAETPLYFKNGTQINAQAPFELLPNSTAPVVVEVDGNYSVPEEIAVARSRPGVFALLGQSDRAIVQFPNGALSGPAVPVRAGDTVTIYLSGIGAVNPAVATNSAPPAAEPFARAVANFSAKVGDRDAAVVFLGLTPGFVGLAQANLVIPQGAPVGPDIPLTISVGGQPSKPLFISVGAPLP